MITTAKVENSYSIPISEENQKIMGLSKKSVITVQSEQTIIKQLMCYKKKKLPKCPIILLQEIEKIRQDILKRYDFNLA